MSNRFDAAWQPEQGATTLTTELYIGAPSQPLLRLTDFMSLPRYANRRLLVTDHEWNTQGDALVVRVPKG